VALAACAGAPAVSASEQFWSDRLAIVRVFFDLLRVKDIAAWADLWADDSRIIVPYPPTGFGTSLDGKAAILEAFRVLFANFVSFDCNLTGLYPAADSDAVCVETRSAP
jgi:ketosteroid isomerase-like protein